MSERSAYNAMFRVGVSKVGPYDEYSTWDALDYVGERFAPVIRPPCETCHEVNYSLSGTCLRCKATREGFDLFQKLCLVVGAALWSSLDDSSKRFMMMELR